MTPFFHVATRTFSYLVACPATGAVAIIDPCLDFDAVSGRTGRTSVDTISAAARGAGLRVGFVLETDAHAGHLRAAQVLLAEWSGASFGIGAGITDVQAHFRPMFEIPESEAGAGAFDRLFGNGERFALGALRVELIPTPVQTDDSVSYRTRRPAAGRRARPPLPRSAPATSAWAGTPKKTASWRCTMRATLRLARRSALF